MNRLTLETILFFLIVFSFSTCTDQALDIGETFKSSSSKIYIHNNQNQTPENESIIIYDYDQRVSGLNMVPIASKNSGNIKKDVLIAFLENNHFLTKPNQVTLSRIEEVGTATTFYLTSSLQDLGNPTNLKLFKKALELTILGHLKSNDFNIIYDETTAQL